MSDPSNACGWLEPKGKSIRALLWHTPLGEAWLAFRIAGTVFGRLWLEKIPGGRGAVSGMRTR